MKRCSLHKKVSDVCISPFSDTDELKMALRARKVSWTFEKRALGQSRWSASSLLSSCYCHCYFHILDIKESIRQLTLLIWAHLVVMTIILTLIAIILMLWKLISYKRRRKISRHVNHLSQVVCDKSVSG